MDGPVAHQAVAVPPADGDASAVAGAAVAGEDVAVGLHQHGEVPVAGEAVAPDHRAGGLLDVHPELGVAGEPAAGDAHAPRAEQPEAVAPRLGAVEEGATMHRDPPGARYERTELAAARRREAHEPRA